MSTTFDVRCVHPEEMVLREEAMQAASEAELRARLAQDGLVVLRVKAQRRGLRTGAALRADFPLLCREIRTLIRAGMTVVEAVDTLCARDGPGPREPGLAELLRGRLRQGQALSSAIAALPGAPAVLVAAVRAGERTSNLAEALDEYLRFDELVQRLRRKVISAAIYPALVTGLGVLITLFLLIVVMPSFARMYQNLRGKASGFTGWMIDVSMWVSEHRATTLLAVGLLALALGWAVSSGAANRGLARAAASVPWLRARIHDFQLAMLYQSLALLLKGGYPMVQAMEIGGQSALGTELAVALERARAGIVQGTLVSQALVAAGLCDEVDRRLMAAAERNGEFPRAAEVVAQLHGERFELFVERMARIVEPVLLLGVAVMVGGIVVAMYLPVFDMATRLR